MQDFKQCIEAVGTGSLEEEFYKDASQSVILCRAIYSENIVLEGLGTYGSATVKFKNVCKHAAKTYVDDKVKKEIQDDLAAAKDMQKSLGSDCKWVKTHFDTRRKKRKAEMEGLVEARDFLAGVEQGKAVLAPSED